MIWRMFLEIGIALFAVYGVACAARVITEWIFPQKELAVAVRIRTVADAWNMDFLLHEAGMSFYRRGKNQMIVLISDSLMSGIVGEDGILFDVYEELIDQYGAECYLVEMD